MSKSSSPFDNFSSLGSLPETDTEYEVSRELLENRDVLAESREHPSFRPFYIVAIIFAFILLIRLLNLQVTHGYDNRSSAEGNRLRLIHVEPTRGIISDRHGEPLVRNIPAYNLEVYPADLPKLQSDRQDLYKKVSIITGLSTTIFEKVEKNGLASLNPVALQENLNRDQALEWEAKLVDIPGVIISKSPQREYSNTNGLSHILGYMGKVTDKDLPRQDYDSTSMIGKTGIEATYEKELRGKSGLERAEVDAHGRLQRVLSQLSPEAGNNLLLNIDNNIQAVATTALAEAMQANNSQSGVAIALDPRDGAVISLVSLPAYDNNLFSHGISSETYRSLLEDKNHPMVDRAINGVYPSGSVVKPVIASGALQEKVISEHTLLDTSPGAIRIGEWVFPDWKVHGITDVRKAIAESNDIFFYAVGGGWSSIRGLGIDKLDNWLRQFGYGSPTGIDLPGETSGLVPDDAWKRKKIKEPWYIGDTYHLSIGQGYFLATPLQVTNAIAAIANGGELLKPHLLNKVVDSKGNIIKTVNKEVIRSNYIDPYNLQVVREGMRQAVTSGSARLLNDLPVQAAAKTGTAQYANNQKSHAWFTSFAPLDKPEIVVTVMVEGGGEGYVAAGPVAKKILSAYFSSPR